MIPSRRHGRSYDETEIHAEYERANCWNRRGCVSENTNETAAGRVHEELKRLTDPTGKCNQPCRNRAVVESKIGRLNPNQVQSLQTVVQARTMPYRRFKVCKLWFQVTMAYSDVACPQFANYGSRSHSSPLQKFTVCKLWFSHALPDLRRRVGCGIIRGAFGD